MNISIHFDNQRCLVTVEIDNETRNDLLPSKAHTQFLGAHFLPETLFSRRHLAA
jgi:hypothetical protein